MTGRDPLRAALAGLAEHENSRFVGAAGVRIGESNTVHAVQPSRWIAGLTRPGPACHTGFALDLSRLSPASGPVSCQRCQGLRSGIDEQAATHADQLQIDLGDAPQSR